MNLAALIASLFRTVVSIVDRPAAPTATVTIDGKPDVVTTLQRLILANTESIGPMPTTGGQIFAVTPDEAREVATLIVADAASFGLSVSLVAALIRGESDFSPQSVDPNDELDKPGEAADQHLMHADLGIEQEDVATAVSDPQFKGITLGQIATKLYDPVYGVRFVCTTLSRNIALAHALFAADPTLRTRVPNGDPMILACEAYNTGFHGALSIARTAGIQGNWRYGTGVVQRAAGWAKLLDP